MDMELTHALMATSQSISSCLQRARSSSLLRPIPGTLFDFCDCGRARLGKTEMQSERVRSSWHELSGVFYNTVGCSRDPGPSVSGEVSPCRLSISTYSE